MSHAGFGRERPLVQITDDDGSMRLLMSTALMQEGFDTAEAENGAAGIEQCVVMRPDIVLLDVQLPDIDGFEVCRRLRAAPELVNVPIIMVTGLDDVASINRAYEVGATDFITKPINWIILAHRVRYVLRSSNAFRELHLSENNNRALLAALPDMILRFRRDGHCVSWEGGRGDGEPSRFIGRNLGHVMPDTHSEMALHHIGRALDTLELQTFEYQVPHEGSTRNWEARMIARDEHEVIAVMRDITEHKQAIERIHYLAYYDSLTGLLNRQSFNEQTAKAISRAQRRGTMVGVLFLDLDRFKRINDTLGHTIGDKALTTVAERLGECLRDYDVVARDVADDAERHVARLGGDEFTVLLTDIRQAEDAAQIARRIIERAAEAMSIEGHDIVITPSIGIALYPMDGHDVDTLLKHADRAMYFAKEQGKNNYQFYSHTMNARAYERLNLESRLRKALERGELMLHYQPQVDLATRRVVGVEGLLRWRDPESGLILPAEIIPVAEETGLIVPIGEWMLRSACVEARALQDAGVPPMTFAINLSARQFRQKNLASLIAAILAETGLQPQYLALEITEETMMQMGDETLLNLNRLKEIGVSLSLDDFGTGYSSLSYLSRFPVDSLKVDRSFVDDIAQAGSHASITAAIIAMARSLNMKVIAEGVETEAQLAFLELHRCDIGQGFYFSHPLPFAELNEFMCDVVDRQLPLAGVGTVA